MPSSHFNDLHPSSSAPVGRLCLGYCARSGHSIVPCIKLVVLQSSNCAPARRMVSRSQLSAFVTWHHDLTFLVNLLLGSAPNHQHLTDVVHCLCIATHKCDQLIKFCLRTPLLSSDTYQSPSHLRYISVPLLIFDTYQSPFLCPIHTPCSSRNTHHVFPVIHILCGRICEPIRFRPAILIYVRLPLCGHSLKVFARDGAILKSVGASGVVRKSASISLISPICNVVYFNWIFPMT